MANSTVYFYKKRILTSLSLFLIWVCLLMFIFIGSFFLDNTVMFSPGKSFYVPALDYLRVVSGSYRSFAADIFYIRGVLAIAEKVKGRNAWVNWVQKNFELAVRLDPKLIQGYFFAGAVIGKDKLGINKGIKFLKRGIKRNPDEWELPYWLGFNYYQLGDYLKAVAYYRRASNLPGAPEFLKSIQPMLYYKGRRADLGIIYLEGLLKSVKEKRQLKWVKKKINWLKGIVLLEAKVHKFKVLYGSFPCSLKDLVKRGLIDKIPRDVFGMGYYLDKKSGKVRSKFGSSPVTAPIKK